MKQLVSHAHNLLVAIQDDKTGRQLIPQAEIVISTVEPVYRMINNQMVREPVVSDHRFAVGRASLADFIEDLTGLAEELAKMESHFDETQTKFPL